jgi:hypothetical protein
VIDAYLAETARVLRPGGRFFIMSNTSDRSSLQPLTDASRKLGRLLVRAGLYDFQREARRKSDHIKALRTWQDVLDAMQQAGLRPVRVVFWNSVFTSFVEHVLMKLGEAALGRRTNDGGRTTKDDDATDNPSSSVLGLSSDGTHREIRARQRMRGRLERRGPSFYALTAVTLLMELDLWLFGALMSGSYCMVVEKPAES